MPRYNIWAAPLVGRTAMKTLTQHQPHENAISQGLRKACDHNDTDSITIHLWDRLQADYMYTSISVVTFRVSISGAIDSTSCAKHSAREALAAISTALLLSMALTFLYTRTVLISSPMRIEPLRCSSCALVPDDSLNGMLLTL